jgi:hypothetical protein
MTDRGKENVAGDVGEGAVSGAAEGTAILPGWGTAIGTVVGAGLGLMEGILGKNAADAASAQNEAIALLNYNAKMQDAQNEILIGSMNAANALKDAQALQKQWGWKVAAFAENSQMIEASSAYKLQGLGLEQERLIGKQTAEFSAAGVKVGVGTAAAQPQIAKEMFGRQINALEQEAEQQRLGNALKATLTASEFQSQIEHYRGEAEVYRTEAAARAQSDYNQAKILYAEGMAKSGQQSSQGLGSLLGGGVSAVTSLSKLIG